MEVWLFRKLFPPQKCTLRRSNHFLKTQWEIHLLTFLDTDRNFKKIIIIIEKNNLFISNLLLESIFNFEKWSNRKYAITLICVFSVWPLANVENLFWKHIWNEIVFISVLNFFWRVLVNIKKNGFPIVFSKRDLTGVEYTFWWNFFWKRQTFQNMPKFRW